MMAHKVKVRKMIGSMQIHVDARELSRRISIGVRIMKFGAWIMGVKLTLSNLEVKGVK